MSVWVEDLSGAETNCLVRFTHKHGMPIGLGEQCDCAQLGAVLLIELAGRLDKTHRGFTAVDNRHPLELLHHELLKGCSKPDDQLTLQCRNGLQCHGRA
jgi:hypothetical protein